MRPTGRDASVDVARGVSIVAIALGHVVLGLAAAGLMERTQSDPVIHAVYLFHLSTFAYLAGLFVASGVGRSGRSSYVTQRIALFAWLYVLWGVAQSGVRVAAGTLVNTPPSWVDVLRFWVPEGQLWFLPWLMSATVIAAVVRPWASKQRAVLSIGLATPVALSMWGIEPLYVFTRGWSLLVPFLLGCVVTAKGHARMFGSVGRAVVLTIGCGAVWLWVGLGTNAVLPTMSDHRSAAGVALGVLGCTAGTIACLSASTLLSRTPVTGLLELIGRRSLEIFLAHIVVTSGTRIVLSKLGVDDLVVHLVLATTLGVLIPIWMAVIAERLGLQWIFGLPRALGAALVRSANAKPLAAGGRTA